MARKEESDSVLDQASSMVCFTGVGLLAAGKFRLPALESFAVAIVRSVCNSRMSSSGLESLRWDSREVDTAVDSKYVSLCNSVLELCDLPCGSGEGDMGVTGRENDTSIKSSTELKPSRANQRVEGSSASNLGGADAARRRGGDAEGGR